MNVKSGSYCGVDIETQITDRLINLTNGTERIIDQGHNLVVINFGKTVASLLKNDPTYGFGLLYLAVGQGEGTDWDVLTTTERQAKSLFSLTELYDEVGRVSIGSSIVWLDPDDVVSETPTNRIEVTATLDGSISGSLRELALFAGTATETVN